MRLLLAANNQGTRRNETIKATFKLGSSSNRYAPRLPQQETKSSTKQLPPTDPILGPENLLKTGFAQKGLPSCPSGRHKPQSFIETKTLRFCNLDTTNFKKWTETRSQKWDRLAVPFLGPHAPLSKKTKKSTFTVSFWTVWRYQKWDRKIAKSTAKADPCNEQKMTTAFS